jgi:hypothetical protein
VLYVDSSRLLGANTGHCPMAGGDRVENANSTMVKIGGDSSAGKALGLRANVEQQFALPTFTAHHDIGLHFDSEHDENSA